MNSKYSTLAVSGAAAAFFIVACEKAPRLEVPPDVDRQIEAISQAHVFADMHAHPSRFHRANVETIAEDEIARYLENHMSVVVANVSSDMAYSGGYWLRNGQEIERGRYKPEPGETFLLALDRLRRLHATVDQELAIRATGPKDALAARQSGQLAIIPALAS